MGQGTLPLFFADEADRDGWTKAMRGTSTLFIWWLQPEKQANGEERMLKHLRDGRREQSLARRVLGPVRKSVILLG